MIKRFGAAVVSILGALLYAYLNYTGMLPELDSASSSEQTRVPSQTPSANKSSPAQQSLSEAYHNVRVLDGDTIKLKTGQTVRLIGVDTPETSDPDRNLRNAERTGADAATVERFAQEAKNYLKREIGSKPVRLEFDREKQDRYGRLLAYVYTSEGAENTMMNAKLIKEGYGFAYTRFPFKYDNEFKSFENEARASRRGLWK